MKEILTRLFGKGSGIVEQVGINAEADMQKNVTERWKADMTSDSWLSKNVRPLVLMFLIFNTMLLIFIDAGQLDFKVEDNWVSLLEVLL
jgi:hypothetical protein